MVSALPVPRLEALRVRGRRWCVGMKGLGRGAGAGVGAAPEPVPVPEVVLLLLARCACMMNSGNT